MVVIDTVALYNCLKEDLLADNQCDPTTVFAKATLASTLLKKLSENVSPDADAKALDKFLLSNLRCRNFPVVKQLGLFDSELLGHFREEIHRFFEPNNRGPLVPSLETIFIGSRPGPGKTIGTRETDLYNKLFSSTLTATSEKLFRFYRAYVESTPRLLEAEKLRLEMGFGCSIVGGSALKFVPKNDEISRVICIEPSLNVFFQLGLGAAITRRLFTHFRIDLSTQPDVNRELARLGSLDGSLVTLDLESASDSISWKMILSYFPRSFWTWLWDLRSPTVTLPSGDEVQAYMVSSMGNGFTFPLQTAIFSCIVSAAYRYLRKEMPPSGNGWSVFGDDIIVRQEIVAPVTRLLSLLGFTLNATKSFFEGPFRESCGSDYYIGTNVRGVYLKTLKTDQDLCIAINSLNRWSADHGVYLPRVIRYLQKHGGRKPFVPRWENDDAGIKVPFSMVTNFRKSKALQSVVYRRFAARPAKLFVTDLKVLGRSFSRQVNPAGAELAFIAGVVEGRKSHHHASVVGTISVRHNTTVYRRTMGVAPNWDHDPLLQLGTEDQLRVWSRHVRVNLI